MDPRTYACMGPYIACNALDNGLVQRLFDDLNGLVAFLRDEGNLTAVRLKVEIEDLGIAATLKTAPTSVFTLRWGTVSAASKDLTEMGQALRMGMHTDLFPCWPEAKKAFQTATSHELWLKNTEVDFITSDIEHERTWLQGCQCHEEECIEASKKGSVFECPDKRKVVMTIPTE